MASYVAAGATKLASDDQNAAMQSGYYPPPGPNGQYPPPPPQGYAAPPYAAPPPVANNGPQYATVDMSGAYSQPSSAGGYIWGAPAVGQAMAQGIEGDPAARQRIEAQAKLHELEIGDRMRFLRKVYGILFCQLALTCGISAAMMFAGYNFKVWLIQNFWFPWVLLVVCLITLFGLYAKRHDTPTNYILLVLFTCLEAFSVGSIVTFYDSRVVLQAFIVGRVTDILKDIATRLRDDFQTTTAVFIGLSLFALQTKRDFSFLAPFLSGALMAIIFAGLIQLFLPYSSWWNLLVAIVTALVFCAYIVVDTQQIFRRMSTDEYIAGAVSLYLDILNLFLAFLRIFGAANR